MIKTKKIFLAFLIFFALVILFTKNTFAQSSLPTITIINPVRGNELGEKNVDIAKSFKEQYSVTNKIGLPATWLLQYSAMENNDLVNFAKTHSKNEEYGIFLEIDPNFAKKSGVIYNGQGAWYWSDGLFLTSYDKSDRIKLINTVFKKFKSVFGYYPKTVGAWWVGADSISYMHQKYGVIGVLQCADQFATDAYSIWGTPWSIPYLTSDKNAAIPANSFENNSGVIVMQWAARDPLRAYGPSAKDSTFSAQDFEEKSYDTSYLTYLSGIYLHHKNDQMVVGIESGFNFTDDDSYARVLKWAKSMENRAKIQLAKDYVNEFLKSKTVLSPTHYFLAKDYKNSDQSFWYNSPFYRIGIQKIGSSISVVDLRDYINTPIEDFSSVPNREFLLRINTKAIVDNVRFSNKKIYVTRSSLPLQLKKQSDFIVLYTGSKLIGKFSDTKIILFSENYSEGEISFNFVKPSFLNVLQNLSDDNVYLDPFEIKILPSFNISFLSPVQKLFTVSLLPTSIFSNNLYVLTPFELEALQKVYMLNKKVYLLLPNVFLDAKYKNTRPSIPFLITVDEGLTSVSWTVLTKNLDANLTLPNGDNSEHVLVVPRYVGVDVSPNDETENHLTRIFDNAQIAIYKINK